MRALADTWPVLSPATAGSTRHRQLPSTLAASTGSTPVQGRTTGCTGINPRAGPFEKAPSGFEPRLSPPSSPTAALTCTQCRYFEGRVPPEPFLETYLKRPNPRSLFSSHQGVML
jgi:hypothetical protein